MSPLPRPVEVRLDSRNWQPAELVRVYEHGDAVITLDTVLHRHVYADQWREVGHA